MTSFGPSFTMTAGGNPGTATEGHDIIVYAFFTTTAGVKLLNACFQLYPSG